jgi:hypothetical protein
MLARAACAAVFSHRIAPNTRAHALVPFLRTLFREDWVVSAKQPFGAHEYVCIILPGTRIVWRSPIIGSSTSRTPTRSSSAGSWNMCSRGACHEFGASAFWRIVAAVCSCHAAELCWRLHRQQTWQTPLGRRSGIALVAKASCGS